MRARPDAAADLIDIVTGHDAAALQALQRAALSDATHAAHGAQAPAQGGVHVLSCIATPADFALCRRRR